MSNQKKRSYNSKTRLTKALQTRTRILDSAKKLFQSEGFESVTIEKLAEVSEVSAPTIYLLFQSKRGVLRAIMDEAFSADQHSALVESGKKIQSIKERLKVAATISRRLYDAERMQMALFHGASVLAPEFKELEKEREARRYQRLEESVKWLAKEKALAKGLTITKAHDILWAFTGRDLYRMQVIERGWTSDEYEKWLGDLLVKTLLCANCL